MKSSVFGICRVDGCVYAGVSVSAQKGNKPIVGNPVITVTADDGTPLVFRQNLLASPNASQEKRYSIALPMLVDAPLSINVEDANGSPIEGSPLVITPTRAKWESRFVYRLKKNTADELRSEDERGVHQRIEIQFEQLTPDDDSDRVLASFKTPFHPDSEYRVECYDGKGHLIEIEPVFLADDQHPAPYNPKALIRERRFSFQVPKAPMTLTLAVIDEKHPELTGFRTVAHEAYADLVRRSESLWFNAGRDPRYHDWFLQHRASQSALASQRETPLDNGPLFSIVAPLYRTPLPHFEAMLSSVTSQSYGKWELVLVNASPDNADLSAAVTKAQALDSRVKAITLNENLGITENTNAGLAECQGDFVCFLDHDDLIEPDTLFEYACAIERHPEADLVYCDEDKLEDKTERFHRPFFKSDFDLFLLRCHNYICHFLCARKSLIDELEPASSQFDGAQDHNLTFRVAERAREVVHVPKVLYHWRVTESSTSDPTDEAGNLKKSFAEDAGRLAISSHLGRLGIAGELEPTAWPFVHHVKYLVKGAPTVSIIIPNKDCSAMLETCVRSILDKTTYQHFEIIIVDNNSVEPETPACYEQLVKRDSRVKVVTWPDSFNFSKIVNFGAATATGEYLLLLNNDTEVIAPEWLENMLGICQLPDVGAVGAKLLYEDGAIQHAGVVVTDHITAAHHVYYGLTEACMDEPSPVDLTRQYSAVTAACMLVKRTDFDLVGGFSEEYSVAYNDVDFCFKLVEKGLRIVYEPSARLYHYESISRGGDFALPEKRTRLFAEESLLHERWPAIFIVGDPFLNPNLRTCYFLLRD